MGETPRHAVIVHFNYTSTDLGLLYQLEDQLIRAIDDAKAGQFDGNEIAADGSHGTLYLYGPDADRLLKVVAPVLRSSRFMQDATVTRRYGRPGSGARKTVGPVPG